MLAILITYKYVFLLPFAIIEGPIMTVLCGFLVTLGIFNPVLVYVVIVSGDVIGDSLLYVLGYSGMRKVRFLRISEEKLEKVKSYFSDNHKKVLVMSKMLHGIGFTGLIAAGVLRIPYKKYITVCFLVSLVQTLVLLTVGILFGHLYVTIGKYLNYYVAAASSVGLVLIIFFSKMIYKKTT